MAEQIKQGIISLANQAIQRLKKRVVCLYRVSTVGQVEKDDIPMQKQSCHEYCQHQPDWEIVREFSEKGVSGFKVSAKDRDAIQEIQRMALQGEFDILLVFMFDRLGERTTRPPLSLSGLPKTVLRSGALWRASRGLTPMLTSC